MRTQRTVLRVMGAAVAVAWLLPAWPAARGRSPHDGAWAGLHGWAVAPAAAEEPKDDPKDPPAKPKNLLEVLFGPKSDTTGGAEDGNYTILLYVCRSPTGHVEQAKYFKEATEKHAGWKHLYIVHKDDHSELYWGRYRTIDDARPNLRKAKEYATPAKIKIYAAAIIVPPPGKDEAGPPEWQIESIPPKFVYTVMVAEFYDVPEADYVGRRKFAVDYCKQLRDKGYEAFYRHDDTSSIVTIGAFEASVVQLVRKPGPRDPAVIQQEIDDVVRNFPGLALEVRDTMIRDIRQKPNVERAVKDPRISQILKAFPDLAVNGRQKIIKVVNATTRKVERIPAPTYLMEIPRENVPHGTPRQPPAANRPGDTQPRQSQGDPAGPGRPAGRSDVPRGVPEP